MITCNHNQAVNISYRSGCERLHTFRSKIIEIKVIADRLYVMTERGVYRKDKNGKRWRKVVVEGYAMLVSEDKCRKCGGQMKPSKALGQTFRGKPDFIGSKEIVTVSPGGPGKLIDCMKCEKCGWSVK